MGDKLIWVDANDGEVISFPAVGDGIADDSKAIQQAIDVATRIRGVVLLEPGVYRVGRRVTSNRPDDPSGSR